MKESESKMKDEIAAAVLFITRLVKKCAKLKSKEVDEFSSQLSIALIERFKNHWYQDEPSKGQAYRCLRVHYSEPADPVLRKAAGATGLGYDDLNLPNELTVWVDPAEVTCRLGEIKGSECVLLSKKEGNHGKTSATVDVDMLLDRHQSSLKVQRERFQQFTARRKNAFNSSRANSPSYYSVNRSSTDYHQKTHSPSGYLSHSPVGSPKHLLKFQQNYRRKNVKTFNYSKFEPANQDYQQQTPSFPVYTQNDHYRWAKGADLVMA